MSKYLVFVVALLMPFGLFAQGVEPGIFGSMPVEVPSVDNPVPDIVSLDKALDFLFQASPWYIAASLILFLAVGLLRGRLVIRGIPIAIPKLSKWFDELHPKLKFYLIIGLTALGCGLGKFAGIKIWTVKNIIIALISGASAGVAFALGAMGAKAGWKVFRDNGKTDDPTPPVTPTP